MITWFRGLFGPPPAAQSPTSYDLQLVKDFRVLRAELAQVREVSTRIDQRLAAILGTDTSRDPKPENYPDE